MNASFVLYHQFSRRAVFDEKGLKRFRNHLRQMASRDVKYIIIEDYWRDGLFGEYTQFWNFDTFKAMVAECNDRGMRVLPYICLTELNPNSETFHRYGQQWGARNAWGSIYNGMVSFQLPYYDQIPFMLKVMCPYSPWQQHLASCIRFLHENLDLGGFYFDRADYRLKCHAHVHPPANQFEDGLVSLVQYLTGKIKSLDARYVTMQNDSLIVPDDTFRRIASASTFILTELMPQDNDPRGLFAQGLANWAHLLWLTRSWSRHLVRGLYNVAFYGNQMTDRYRIQQIVRRLQRNVAGKDIFLFTHRLDEAGAKIVDEVARAPGVHRCFYEGN